MNTLSNKVALISGSARGLGKAIAERYAALGASIVLNYSLDKTSAEKVVDHIKSMGNPVIAVQADINKVSDIERLFVEARNAFGKIDIVAANAGVEQIDIPVIEFTEEQFDRVFAINTKGTYLQYSRLQSIRKITAGLFTSLPGPPLFLSQEWL